MNRTSRLSRRAAAISVAALLTFTAAACDGGEDSGSAAPKDKESAAAGIPDASDIVVAVAPDSALTETLPGDVKSKGSLTIGSYVGSPPNNFYGPDNKTPVGFEVDLITAIGNRLGLKVEYKDMAFDSVITSLQTGRVDTTISEMNDTKERQAKIDFIDYFQSGISIMIQKGNPKGITTTDDLCGKKVVVVTGTTQEEFAKQQSTACTDDGNDPLEITATDSLPQNQTQLQIGRVDALLADLAAAAYTAQTAGGGKLFEVVDQEPISGAPYGIGVAKKNTELRDALQASLQSLIDDGTYTKIMDTWDVTSGAVEQATINGG
ncbi:ABC transporter substrate-binding protein [Aeromicrobium endophyticum]|uniref:ABC transporter substrate-binding protein n=1 Tax=Aeromicrobium endophyticum TaxID=2292704 RepID=A0A371NYT6_9ACTN|nr:ABC transporter substrate-binding protein [Aeromicrobium endophyticum]REK68854.1 ABC transporter substrate-binding protein [Aeromicrobium endophyticum]